MITINQIVNLIDIDNTTIILAAGDNTKEEQIEYRKGSYDEGVFWQIRKCKVVKIAAKAEKLILYVELKGMGFTK